MKADTGIFKAIGELAIGAKRRREAEYADFIAFYRELVETLPIDVCDLFGTLNEVQVMRAKASKSEGVGLELNVADLMWWQHEIKLGTRFVHGIKQVKSDMLRRLTLKAETERLSPEERKSLISMLDRTTA